MWWKIPTHFCVLVLPCGFLSCWKVQEFVAYCNNAIWNHFFNSCSIIWNNCLVSIYDFFNQIKCTINDCIQGMQTIHIEELEYIIRLNWKKFSAAPIKVYLVVYVIFPCGSFFTRSPHFFFNYMCWGKFSLHVWKKYYIWTYHAKRCFTNIHETKWLLKLVDVVD